MLSARTLHAYTYMHIYPWAVCVLTVLIWYNIWISVIGGFRWINQMLRRQTTVVR